MWVDLVAMAAVGVLAACLVFIFRHRLRRSGRQLPRWITPAVIGAGMMAYSIWNEYSWFGRVTASLPPTVAVVGEGQRRVVWAPWTYVLPVTVRFVALDSRVRVQSEQRPGLVLTELLLVERWQATRRVPVAFDCLEARRADLISGVRIEPDGTLEGGEWQTMAPDSPMMRAACQPTLPA